MTDLIKAQIIAALESYLTENAYSANEFAVKSDVPSNYITYMRDGSYRIPGKEKDTIISDKYFRMVAQTIQFNLGEKVLWTVRQTPQLMQMLSYLQDASDYGYTSILIGSTGSGKTFATDLFIRRNPKDNFKITVGSMDTIADIIDRLCIELRISAVGSKSKKISAVIKELNKMRLSGRKPALIFDEAEFMKQPTLCNIKEMYDHLYGKCALILIGTDQLIANIEKLKNKNAQGMPQFYRRVKYGIRYLRDIDSKFPEFLTAIEDKGLKKFLMMHCENYGDLHDVMIVAMRKAEALNEPLTENLVRKVLNMQK